MLSIGRWNDFLLNILWSNVSTLPNNDNLYNFQSKKEIIYSKAQYL